MDGETILQGAKRQGFTLPNACRSGTCQICEATLVSGSVRLQNSNRILRATSAENPHNIYCCQAYPMENLQLEVKTVLAPGQLPIHDISAQIVSVSDANHSVKIIKIRLPAGKPIDFYPGQYLLVHLPENEQAAFSIASAPNKDRTLELHVGAAPSSRSYGLLAPKLVLGELLKLSLPYGETTLLGLAKAQQLIFIAAGTGFSQIKAMVEGLIKAQDTRPTWIYWGVKSSRDLYLHDAMIDLATQNPHIKYIPVVSEDPSWGGRLGLVHKAVLEDGHSFENLAIVCGGSPTMVYSAFDDFIDAGMDPTQMHSDVFAYAPR